MNEDEGMEQALRALTQQLVDDCNAAVQTATEQALKLGKTEQAVERVLATIMYALMENRCKALSRLTGEPLVTVKSVVAEGAYQLMNKRGERQ